MIKVENIDTCGFDHAVRAARNPMNSWSKSDSEWESGNWCDVQFNVGENDLDLMHRLYKSGVEHRTYVRMIMIWMDVTAPLYWWKEADRYTVGKSQVSTSTMHKIHAKEFTKEDFSIENITNRYFIGETESTISNLNMAREEYLRTKDKSMWYTMIEMLPSSYNQKRTICMSYEVAMKMIKERKNHKLDEWREFVQILEELPYMKEIMGAVDGV